MTQLGYLPLPQPARRLPRNMRTGVQLGPRAVGEGRRLSKTNDQAALNPALAFFSASPPVFTEGGRGLSVGRGHTGALLPSSCSAPYPRTDGHKGPSGTNAQEGPRGRGVQMGQKLFQGLKASYIQPGTRHCSSDSLVAQPCSRTPTLEGFSYTGSYTGTGMRGRRGCPCPVGSLFSLIRWFYARKLGLT